MDTHLVALQRTRKQHSETLGACACVVRVCVCVCVLCAVTTNTVPSQKQTTNMYLWKPHRHDMFMFPR